MGELESRVEPLRKQSEKAQKFITLSDEKKTLEIGVWVNKINRFTNELREQEHKIDAANASYDICEKELKAIEEEIKYFPIFPNLSHAQNMKYFVQIESRGLPSGGLKSL